MVYWTRINFLFTNFNKTCLFFAVQRKLSRARQDDEESIVINWEFSACKLCVQILAIPLPFSNWKTAYSTRVFRLLLVKEKKWNVTHLSSHRGRGNWVGVCGPLPKTLILFMTKIHLSISLPYFNYLFMTKTAENHQYPLGSHIPILRVLRFSWLAVWDHGQ